MAGKKLPKGIVVFKFSPNECYTGITDEIPVDPPGGFTIDVEARTWSTRGRMMQLGESDVISKNYCRAGYIIGVYDVTEMTQLESLVRLSASIAEDGAHGAIYD